MKYRLSIALLLLSQCLLITPFTAAAENSRGVGIQQIEKKWSTPTSPGVYRALIIGNNNYQDKDGLWKPLTTAVPDARAVKNLLANSYGFSDIQVLENATRKEVLQAFDALSQKVLADDHVLVYYAGHGFMETEINRGFWVPVDAKGKDNTTYLRNSTIRDELTTIASRARHTLLISDSCFSGSLLRRGTRGAANTSNSEQYYKKVANKKSVQIMTAGGLEYVDDKYKSSDHSPFTYFLLSELKNNDKPMMTLSELSNNVERAVANNVDQVPESGVLQGAGDELGEFIFIKMDLMVDGVSPDKVKVQVNIKQADETQLKKTKQPTNTEAIKNKGSNKIIVPVPTL